MTNQQLKIAIAVAELQSISSAAKALDISQPNASNSLRALESELGFAIFSRGSGGAVPTKKGELFLAHARQILAEHEKIMTIRNAVDVYRLRLGTVNYSAVAEPFVTLCEAHREDRNSDLRCYNVSVSEGISELNKHHLDIVAAPLMQHQIVGISEECKRYRIKMESICHVPSVILVRKGHPALADGRLSRITRGCDLMKDYPYIAYRNLFEESSSNGYNDAEFIPSNGKIIADEIDLHLRLIASTDGFSFGICSTRGLTERYGLVSFPVEGVSVELFVLTHADEKPSPEIEDYLYLLKKNMLLLLQ